MRIIEIKNMDLISYGLESFSPDKFDPIKNRGHKPDGGLWSSPVKSKWGWRDWCKSANYGDLSTHFNFSIRGKVLIINSYDGLIRTQFIKDGFSDSYLYKMDFEKISTKADALWLTKRGERETKFTHPGLYGWDCETVLILNPKCIYFQPNEKKT